MLLAFNVADGLDRPLAQSAPPGYRYWEDFGVAVRLFRGDRGSAPVPSDGATDFEAAQKEIDRLGIKPWQFWRIAREGAFPGAAPQAGIRPLEDTGRARLVALFFRLRSGIAPIAPFWPAVLLAAPLLAWTSWEMSRAGHVIAAGLFLLAVSCSGFVTDVLPLAYSPTGFYVLGLLLIVPWATYALSETWTARGLLVRATVCGAVLALCVWCRSGTLMVLTGFLAAGAVAARRSPPRTRAAVVLFATAILATPPLVTRVLAGGHDVWITMWEGLGDFDRSKGHVWSDAAAKRAARARGIDDLRSPEAQAFFRADVTRSIRSDPGWYAAILARRAVATAVQSKLWGPGIRPSAHPGTGAMDGYFALARTADVFTVAGRDVEVPVPLLLAGPVLLAILMARASPPPPTRGAWIVVSVVAGAFGVPVIVSTAGGLETQAATLAWLLAWAFVAEWALAAFVERRAGRATSAE